MLIGIHGKLQSGKNLLAGLFQLIIDEYSGDLGPAFKEGVFSGIYDVNRRMVKGPWKQKAFAGKLKQMVSYITACRIEDLEKEEFKNRVLPEAWQLWAITNFTKETKIVFTDEQEAIDFCKHFTNSQHQYSYKKTQRTYRWLMQKLGTEAGRDVIHPNIWINAALSDYEAVTLGAWNGTVIDYSDSVFPKWIFTDVRFENEAFAILKRKGILIKIVRPGKDNTGNHASETALDKFDKWNYIIINDGSIEDLYNKLRKIMLKEGFINETV